MNRRENKKRTRQIQRRLHMSIQRSAIDDAASDAAIIDEELKMIMASRHSPLGPRPQATKTVRPGRRTIAILARLVVGALAIGGALAAIILAVSHSGTQPWLVSAVSAGVFSLSRILVFAASRAVSSRLRCSQTVVRRHSFRIHRDSVDSVDSVPEDRLWH